MDQSETGDQAEDQGPQRLQERTAARPAARAGVRSERAVQEGLRRRVRRLRRRAVRALVGDYEFGKDPEDIELLEKISQRGGGGARAVPVGGQPEMFNLESYTQLDAPRDYRQDLRHHRVRQVEELPRRAKIRATSA